MVAIPTAARAEKVRAGLDQTVPALLLKLGAYPLHHGGMGVVRSLGRAGVDVYAVTENGHTPVALSRHLRARLTWPTTGTEEPEELVDGLLGLARAIGRPAVLVPTDDEAAVVVAEQADALDGPFLLPRSADPGLVRRLASKEGLYRICTEHGVPTPAAVFPEGRDDVERYAATGRFPVVVKSRDAFGRKRMPTVRASTVVSTPEGLRALAADWPDGPAVILQEYIPREDAEDWFSHAWTERGASGVVYTGVKVRSWPPHAGMTTCAYAAWNPEVAAMTEKLFAAVGFSGIADLDWRFDRRDGRYKLLDFNPRVGAQFRLFSDAAGVDVVRAQHLALTGRPIPSATFPEGRRFLVDDFDLAARLAYRRDDTGPAVPARAAGTEMGWFALDDPLPFFSLVAGRLAPAATKALQTAAARVRRRI